MGTGSSSRGLFVSRISSSSGDDNASVSHLLSVSKEECALLLYGAL
jgi:hypothetical protein